MQLLDKMLAPLLKRGELTIISPDGSFSVDVPSSWPSGLYAVRLEGPGGLRRHIPFTVRHGGWRASFAWPDRSRSTWGSP